MRNLAAHRRSAIADVVQGIERILQILNRFSASAMRRFGVTGPQIWALRILAANDTLTQGTLALRMYLHPSTVSGVVDRLERRGLLRRTPRKEDRRVIQVRITTQGRALLGRLPEPPRARLPRRLGAMSDRTLAETRASILRIARIMDAGTDAS